MPSMGRVIGTLFAAGLAVGACGGGAVLGHDAWSYEAWRGHLQRQAAYDRYVHSERRVDFSGTMKEEPAAPSPDGPREPPAYLLGEDYGADPLPFLGIAASAFLVAVAMLFKLRRPRAGALQAAGP